MSRTVEVVIILTLTAVLLACRGDAEDVRTPTNVSYAWLDPLTVNVSWEKPIGNFQYAYVEKSSGDREKITTPWRYFIAELLTENMVSDNWTFLIRTITDPPSPEVSQIINIPQPRAEVNNITCIIINQTNGIGMNCSWIPGNQTLKLSHRFFGMPAKTNNTFRLCTRSYSGPTRNGCYLDGVIPEDTTCLLFQTPTGFSTYKLKPMVDPPKLSIREEDGELKLSWPKPEIPQNCEWTYTVFYRKCNHSEFKELAKFLWRGEPMSVPYNKDCRYEFRSSVKADLLCKFIFSDLGQVVSYGTTRKGGNATPDETLTVVAIVLPIILSVCIFLSCYCFRRYSSIICPVIPDPSAIFKEMMMNGNKEHKITGTLYAPVPEPIESCRVDPVPDYMLKS